MNKKKINIKNLNLYLVLKSFLFIVNIIINKKIFLKSIAIKPIK